MNRSLFLLMTSLFLLFVSDAMAAIYSKEKREKYILDALTILKATDRREVEDTSKYIQTVYRTRCRSNFERYKIECLKQAVNDSCLQRRKRIKNCKIYSDVIIVNKLSERYFVTGRERYEIMKKHPVFRPALVRQLDRHYAQLAADFGLSQYYECKPKDFKCLSKSIDNYCMDSSDYKGLSWQNCVSALSWFIGNASR